MLRVAYILLLLMVPSLARAANDPPAVAYPAGTEPQALPAPGKLHGAYRMQLIGRINPLGLFIGGVLQARTRLYLSDNPALRDNYVGFGATTVLSPALARIGAMLELQPLSVLQMTAAYELLGFYRTFEYMQSFPSANDNAADSQLKALKAAGTTYATYGGIFTLGTQLTLKFGPIVLRSGFRAILYDMKLRDGDRTWYDITLDIMTPKNGWVITDDTDLLFVHKSGVRVGARYTVTHSVMNAESYAPGETIDPTLNPVTHRLGPFFAYTFYDREGSKFNQPTLVLIAQWWLKHRYRTGQDVSQGIPWLVIAFNFNGTII